MANLDLLEVRQPVGPGALLRSGRAVSRMQLDPERRSSPEAISASAYYVISALLFVVGTILAAGASETGEEIGGLLMILAVVSAITGWKIWKRPQL